MCSHISLEITATLTGEQHIHTWRYWEAELQTVGCDVDTNITVEIL